MKKNTINTKNELIRIKKLRNSFFLNLLLFAAIIIFNFLGIKYFRPLILITFPAFFYVFYKALKQLNVLSEVICPECNESFGLVERGKVYFINNCQNCELSLNKN